MFLRNELRCVNNELSYVQKVSGYVKHKPGIVQISAETIDFQILFIN